MSALDVEDVTKRFDRTLAVDGLSFSVQDDGIGLPEGFSLEDASSLGLSIVSTLVGELGGRISLGRRVDGTGTCVEVWIPDVATGNR